jgi:hypothetical protein
MSLMLQPSDFWKAAKYLIGRYGAEAGSRADRRATALRDQGDAGGHTTWRILATTVFELQSPHSSATDGDSPMPAVSAL